MIQGTKKVVLNKELIFSMISPYDIYKHFFGNFKLNVVTSNHLRGEKDPSFIIGTKYGEITHKDFGDEFWKGNCINLVQQIHRCDYMTALRIIDREFGLGIETTEIKDYRKIISEYKQPIIEEKKYSTVQCVTRKFTHEELAYWNGYHQDITDLRRENIYSISKVFLNKERFTLKDTELRFGYLYEGSWKIYVPFAENPKLKWMPNNVPIDYLEGKENIVNCDTALITKSKKDKMVCLKIYPHVCASQNESKGCFTEENVKYIKDNSKKQLVSFDSDKPGCKASLIVTKEFDMGYINVPRTYLSDGINDWALLGKEYGLSTVERIFKKKGLIV